MFFLNILWYAKLIKGSLKVLGIGFDWGSNKKVEKKEWRMKIDIWLYTQTCSTKKNENFDKLDIFIIERYAENMKIDLTNMIVNTILYWNN